MSMPSPEGPGCAPVWENYVIAQTVAASRGQIPEHALAFGVEVDGPRLRLRFQLSEVTEEEEPTSTASLRAWWAMTSRWRPPTRCVISVRFHRLTACAGSSSHGLVRERADLDRAVAPASIGAVRVALRTGAGEQPAAFEDQVEQWVLWDLEAGCWGSTCRSRSSEPPRVQWRLGSDISRVSDSCCVR